MKCKSSTKNVGVNNRNTDFCKPVIAANLQNVSGILSAGTDRGCNAHVSAKYRTHVFLEIADTSSATESVADWADSASDFDANTPAAYLEACAEHDRIVFLIHGG